MINSLKTDYTISELCRTFNIARSTYYYRQNSNDNQENNTENKLYTGHHAYDKDGNLVPEHKVVSLVKEYCNEFPHLGYRMVTNYLNYEKELKVNHKRIYRIMKVLDLLQEQIVPKPKNYQLKQKHELTGPNQLWEMDMVQMYIDESGQWVYMFDIIDVYTREIVGHHESLRCRTKEALAALEQATDNRNTENLTLRTDNGTQFRSREFQRKINELDISHERTTVNTPEENAHIESFHGTLKRSEIYRNHYSDITHCRKSIDKFIDRYNNRRPHSSVGKMPPAVYHKNILNNLVSRVKFAA